MRLTTLALFIGAGTSAVCQSAPPSPTPSFPDNIWQLPQGFTQSERAFGKLPPEWGSLKLRPRIRIRIPNPARHLNDAHIDPQMVVHPPKASLGVQPPGTLVAQNQYPNLRFLPIDWPEARIEPIPIYWPDLKLEPIPAGPHAVPSPITRTSQTNGFGPPN